MHDDRASVAQKAAELLGNSLNSPRWIPQPHQVPPPGDWYGWLLLAGRGAGKTAACSAYISDHVNGPPCLPGDVPHWLGIVAPTLGDAVTACYEGPSGLRHKDPGSRLVQAPGGTVIRWKNGSQAKLFGAHTPEDVERLRAGGNLCVAEGTQVRTETGLRAIESINPGDRVWTRNGLRRVLKVWDNGFKEVFQFNHSSGYVRLTPDHEVWTQSGWTQAGLVKPCDTVLTWENTENQFSTQALHGMQEKTGTTKTNTGGCCIDSSGRKSTESFLPGCISITKITTNRITGSKTCNCSKRGITHVTTIKGANGTVRGARQRGPMQNTVPSSANAANQSSSPVECPTRFGFAPPHAGIMHHEHGKEGCVACAAMNSNVLPDMQPVHVREDVLQSTHIRSVERVYDLTVEHDHEFFAGDLLVSNCCVWMEELAAWRYMDECWDQLRFGLRSGKRPHWIASTTPKPRPLLRKLYEGKIHGVVKTHATMYDNPHLEQHVKDALEETYSNTQLGAQELYGRLLDEDENALWTRAQIESSRVSPDQLPDLIRRTVGVDPSGGAGEQGIVVAGKSGLVSRETGPSQHHGFVLDDRSCHLSPDGWGRRAVQAAIDWEADDICVEVNYGGDQAVAVLGTAMEKLGVQIPVRQVRATRGKAIRAQPVSALSSQERWHHAGVFEELEAQMTTWYPELDWSPDRLDAMVWDAWHLKLVRATIAGQGSFGGSAMGQRIA